MAWSPENSLVIGISSRALFNLDDEDRVYRELGTDKYIQHQRDHEDMLLRPGVAFALIQALLDLNAKLTGAEGPAIEVVVISKNHPDCAIRIERSITHHRLKIKRAIFTGGQSTLPFVRALDVGLFLANDEESVREALGAGVPSGLIFGGPEHCPASLGVPVLAFDGDAVLFSAESERVFQEGGLTAFAQAESDNASRPMAPGPLKKFAEALAELQGQHPIDDPPFRVALVTARDLAYCERPIRTLRSWGIRMDQAFFVSDMSKRIMLTALNPLIFFDDSPKHCTDAASCAPTVHVPQVGEQLSLRIGDAPPPMITPDPNSRFIASCKLFLRKDFSKNETQLLAWYEGQVGRLGGGQKLDAFLGELERSAKGTPSGHQRRASAAANASVTKLLDFLAKLLEKHCNA